MQGKDENSLFAEVEQANIRANAPLAVRMRPQTIYKLAHKRLDIVLKMIFGRKKLLEEALEL